MTGKEAWNVPEFQAEIHLPSGAAPTNLAAPMPLSLRFGLPVALCCSHLSRSPNLRFRRAHSARFGGRVSTAHRQLETRRRTLRRSAARQDPLNHRRHGVLVCNPGKEKETRGHLFTAWEHGDLELDLEFLLTPGSNSGVYLQGRYEVQLFDSWGVREPKPSDCGGIYERWDAARGPGRRATTDMRPKPTPAARPASGKSCTSSSRRRASTQMARRRRTPASPKSCSNGFAIHENVEANGPTRSSAFEDEKPLGPLMVQGDHGSVALRHSV